MTDRVLLDDVHVLAARERGALCVIRDYVMWVPREELRGPVPAVGATGALAISPWFADLYRLDAPARASRSANR